GCLAKNPHRRTGALGLIFVTHELDDLPVPVGELADGLLAGDLWRHLRLPLAGVGEEALVVDGYLLACVGGDGHVSASFAIRVRPWGYRRALACRRWASGCARRESPGPAAGHASRARRTSAFRGG